MEFVLGVSNSTLKTLGSLLSKEYALIGRVRDDVRYINDELETMYAFLLDLNTVEGHDNRTQNWMKKIRDITFDVEDCIREFGSRIPHKSISGSRCSSIVNRIYEIWTWKPRRDIALKIADLKVQLQHVAERRYRYEVNNQVINSRIHAAMCDIAERDPASHSNNSGGRGRDIAERQLATRQLIGLKEHAGVRAATYDIAEHQVATYQLIRMKEPVGVTTDMKMLEEWVDGPGQERAVLSIVGYGGVGKTTIATALYWKVSHKYDCRASVSVSQNYDQDAVMRSILKQIMPQDTEQEEPSMRKRRWGEKRTKTQTMDIYKVVDQMRMHLREKRYLLLIDDIWSAKTWQSIKICLPENNKCSRIIVTSRFQAVGAACSPSGTINLLHTVDFLSIVESKNLFYQSVSESKSSRNSEKVMAKVPEEILKICGGLPLAIVTMAGLVACNPSKSSEDWDKVCKSLFPEPATTLSLDGVARILDFCYNDLPGDLKTCALYLSTFPKGSKVSMKRLTKRLIAEGFVSETQGLTEEEVAEAYFNQLIRRKIICPVEHSSKGKVKSFQVHDMVHEYIVSKSFKENCVNVVGGHWTMPVHNNKVRRLSMQSGSSRHGNSIEGMNLSRVRSLTIFGTVTLPSLRPFNNLTMQVLDLEGCKGLKEKHMNDICKMLSLKYLSFRRTEIWKIPSKIRNLNELETLDIRDTHVEELPKSVVQLKRISSILGGNKKTRKGLRLPRERSKDPGKNMLQQKNKEGMKALRVLSGIEIVGESTAVDGLHQMTGLKKLSICKLDIKKDTETFKQLLSSIEYLSSCGLQTLAINDEYSDFINSLNSMFAPPRYLVSLELSGMLQKPPYWICRLYTLSKLTLSVTVLRTDTLKLLQSLPSLFSLTFSLSVEKKNKDIIKGILEKNKSENYGEIFVPEGFPSLKLLRFFAPFVPKLGFCDNAMPALEMIQMRFDAFEGLFGIDTLENLREVHVRFNGQAAELNESDEEEMQETESSEIQERKETAEITRFLVEDLKNYTTDRLKVIVDYIVNA